MSPRTRALGRLRNAAAILPYHEHLLEEAFEQHDDMLCVPCQLSLLLGRSMKEICASFDDLLGMEQWRAEGICAKTLLKCCALRGHTFFFVNSGKLLLMHDPPMKRGRALAGVAFDGHLYMYKSARCLANWYLASEVERTDTSVLQRENRSSLPPTAE
ncbi:unnamed protein product [Polarella glacialis]|uniref:Uncharacterized protein n=1 Tax=Polarella glacialis TaxID=89957 RepID=A0A813IDF1_POLGL|nr:unnamed protein product [Polarella glacialis]